MKLRKYIHKLCCFYASDWHLTVMLLPYINSKIEENSSIYMKCENDIEEKIDTSEVEKFPREMCPFLFIVLVSRFKKVEK